MLLSQNKKAFADYEILEKIEAGIVLTGPEVKSVRASHINLKGSFVEVTSKPAGPNSKNLILEAWTRNIHISPFKQAPNPSYDPTARRKLLLHAKEILKIKQELETKGTTVVPLDVHLTNNRIKLTIGLCRGKKKYDRRNELKKKAQNLEIKRALKKFSR